MNEQKLKTYILKDCKSEFGQERTGTCEMCYRTRMYVNQEYVFVDADDTDNYYQQLLLGMSAS